MEVKIANAKISSNFSAYNIYAPSVLQSTVISNTEIDLSWEINSFIQEGCHIYISNNSGATYSLKAILTGLTTSFQVTGLTFGTFYCFYMVSFNGTKLSAPSNISCAKTLTYALDLKFRSRLKRQLTSLRQYLSQLFKKTFRK